MSEFSDKYKLMTLNTINEQQANNDANALIRQLAVTYPEGLDWRQKRSYMFTDSQTLSPDGKSLEITGYIRNNFLSVNRLLQMTGSKSVFKISKIELGADPCP